MNEILTTNEAFKVVFYPANVIDYFRMASLYISVMFNGVGFVCIYSLSVLLDYFDGMVARSTEKTSELGKILDMITDRISTVVILVKAIALDNSLLFNGLTYIVFDLFGHLFYFIGCLLNKSHHKQPNNAILALYYKQYVLYTLCLGSEIGFIVIYIISYIKTRKEYRYSSRIIQILESLEFIAKILIFSKFITNLAQMYCGILGLAELESKFGLVELNKEGQDRKVKV
ncbi:CDIPT [Hepatospora eriocheir]|uniref:CDIPT n=1 Tax=Hepatospora eriocheir TaxID=1081669 RepID=A0A1X0QD76_9MICR|nr:CDIPT [Hepatospora eriocheir]